MLQTYLKERTDRKQALREQLTIQPIETTDPATYPDEVRDYFVHFGLDGDGCDATHWFGSFESAGFSLAAHLYQPVHYQATIILLHGYLNHTGQYRHLIRFLLENGYAVAVFDLPGHGLSSGESAAIESFDQYVQVANDFIETVRSRLDGPYHAVGFSTGCSILIELLLTGQAESVDKVVLAAPLIHWTAYEQSKGTYKVYSAFTDKISRFHRRNSSDKDFLIFNKTKDYLHCKHLSLRWVKALFDWNDKLETLPECRRDVLVVQGDKDGTVDWKYNMKMIRKKFPNAKIEMVPGANHELFNEAPEYKNQVLNLIAKYFRQDLQGKQDF
jgi:alpha-beta hydrolase superfamily lysophospholipase